MTGKICVRCKRPIHAYELGNRCAEAAQLADGALAFTPLDKYAHIDCLVGGVNEP